VTKTKLFIGIISCLTSGLITILEVDAASLKNVGITQIVSQSSLDLVKEGVIAGLRQEGFEEGKNLRVSFRNANGDPSLPLVIAQEFVRERMDVIVPITTPSALAVAKTAGKIPVVFGGVTDPSGLV